MAIRNVGLNHPGGVYLYRIHDLKLNSLCNGYDGLKNYLDQVFNNCPNDYFFTGPRSSTLKFKLNIEPIKINGHEISQLARNSLEINKDRYKTNHSRVQVFMLEFDDKTIATEIPIWLKNDEMAEYKKIFKSDDALSGHIDLLRIENEKIWVWDYKPNANKEKYASTQIYFYALMLSKRTGLDLDNFRCGYFDDNSAYIFKPKQDLISKYKLLNEF